MPATGQCAYELGVSICQVELLFKNLLNQQFTGWITILFKMLWTWIINNYTKAEETKQVHQLGSLQGASWLYPAAIALVHAGWKESYRKHQWKAQKLVVLAFFLQPGWLEEAAQKLTGSFRCHVWCITVCWKDESLCSTSFLTLFLSSDSSASDHQSLPWTHFLYLEIGSLAVRQCSISSTGLYLVESSDVEWWPTRYVSAWKLISEYSD